MFKNLSVVACAVVLAASMHVSGAQAGKKTAAAIAVGIGAAALAIAAASAANAHREHDHYGYNHGYGARENAVAACIHRADRRVRRHRRGQYARLDAVKKISKKGGRFKVTMLVTNFYDRRVRQRWVKCHVRHDRVVFFKYN